MDSEKIVYYPHAWAYWCIVAIVPQYIVFSFYFVALCVDKQFNFSAVVALLLVLMELFLAKECIKLSKSVAIFQPDGLICVNMGRNIYDSFSWQDLEYAYICYNIKGHKHLVLSTVPLENRKVKRLTNRGTALIQREGSFVVLYLKLANEPQITEFIRQRMSITYIERFF